MPSKRQILEALNRDELLQILESLRAGGRGSTKAGTDPVATTIRKNASIDWTVRETVRAKLRTLVKRLLRKPDLQEKATATVLKQAELLADEFAGEAA